MTLPSAPTKTEHYQVVIVGGGIAGLTLALEFERLGIKYALFESHASLYPDEGASIGLQPNGLRILDQLGVFEDIAQHTAPIQDRHLFDEDGKLLASLSDRRSYVPRVGYGFVFLERQKVLEAMANGLKHPRGLVKTSSRVTSLKEEHDRVIVFTNEGFSVTADLVVGADGVRSRVRRLIDTPHPGKEAQPSNYMSTHFACVYGISSAVAGMDEGDSFFVFRKKENVIGFTGKDGAVFWFVHEDLGQAYPLSQRPRYTAADAEALCQSVAHLRVSSSLTFGDIYANRKVAVKVPLEEGVAQTWHSHRAVIVGDAAHKTTPAGGMGANQAIEGSAVLANEFRRALAKSPDGKLARDTLYSVLARYTEQHFHRGADSVEKSSLITRALFLWDGPPAGVRRRLQTMSEKECLTGAFLGFSKAPILEDIELTPRGMLYAKTTNQVRETAMKERNEAAK